MEHMNKIAKNFGVLFSSHIVSKSIGFFSLVFTARHLGVENFGILSFAIAFTGIWGVFFTMGLAPLVTREVSRNKGSASQYLGNVITVKLILIVIVSSILFLVVRLFGYSETKREIIYIITLSVIFNSFWEIFNSIFQAYEKMEYQSFAQVLSSILMLSGVLTAIRLNWNVVGFAFLYFFVNLSVLAYSFFICRKKFTGFSIEIDWDFVKRVFRMALPFAASAIILTFFFRIDVTMLSSMHGDRAVGYYSSAWRIVEIFTAIPSLYATAILPVMSVYYVSSIESLKNLYQKSFRFLFVAVLFIQISIIIFADYLISLTYGQDFIQSVKVLQILVWTLSFVFFNHLLGILIVAINKQKVTVFLSLLCLVLNILLNFFFIPRYSYIGAGLSTVITQALFFVFLFAFLSKNRFTIPLLQSFIKPLITGLFIFVVMFIFKKVDLVLAFFSGVVLYIIAVISLKIITREEILAVVSVFYKKIT
jgi:O-antigen/teichoic acid export membrane protein